MTLYTSKVIAQWLCLTERRVRQLRDEGVIVEARPGLYELQPTVARYIKYLGGAGKESLNTERMKLTAEKRKAAEMDNDLRRGDLHSTQDIEKGIQTMCLNIRSRFLAMPAKLLPTPCWQSRSRAWCKDPGGQAAAALQEVFNGYFFKGNVPTEIEYMACGGGKCSHRAKLPDRHKNVDEGRPETNPRGNGILGTKIIRGGGRGKERRAQPPVPLCCP